ncbi:hypothetical protein [Candidatus Hodarchaeum mangrovi]
MSTGFSCRYHSNRDAIDKCENCSAFICLECKKVYQTPYTTSDIDHDMVSDSYSEKHTLCPICYYDNMERAGDGMRRMGFICPFMFIIVFLGGTFLMVFVLLQFIDLWNNTPGPSMGPGPEILLIFTPLFFIIPLVIMVCLLRQFFVKGPHQAKQARIAREAFLESIGDTSLYQQEYDKGEFSSSYSSYCRTCGDRINPDERYCSNCGSSTRK